MAYYDNSSFVGVSLDYIFGPGLDCSQLSEKTRVAVLETDGKAFLQTDGEAVLEKIRRANCGQDGKTVCEVNIETVCERSLDILRETDPETGVERDPWQELDDNEFQDRLEHWKCSSRATEKSILISYQSELTTESHGTLSITKSMFQAMCETLSIPAIFVKAVFATPWKAHTCGQAYFDESNLETDAAGEITGMTIFYHFQSGIQFGRSYIFTRYHFQSNTSTNICINCVPDARASWGTLVGPLRAQPAYRSPFSFHIMLLYHILESLDLDAEKLRTQLLHHEDIRAPPADLALETWNLHHLAQNMHILAEYYTDTEAKVEFLTQAYSAYRDSSWVKTPAATMRQDLNHLEAMRWRTSVSKRWIVDYKDRVNIRINHVFHTSNQEQALATAAIAQDAARESSSMGTVAAVTLFFLPPTFVCAIFGMDFFDVWGDSGSGLGGLKMSSYWWLYPATAVPLTAVVIVIWILWRRFRLEQKSRCLPDIEAGMSVQSLGSVAYSGSVESMTEKEKVT